MFIENYNPFSETLFESQIDSDDELPESQIALNVAARTFLMAIPTSDLVSLKISHEDTLPIEELEPLVLSKVLKLRTLYMPLKSCYPISFGEGCPPLNELVLHDGDRFIPPDIPPDISPGWDVWNIQVLTISRLHAEHILSRVNPKDLSNIRDLSVIHPFYEGEPRNQLSILTEIITNIKSLAPV